MRQPHHQPRKPNTQTDEARFKLVEDNIALAHFFARKTFDMEFEDALSAAMDGLDRAAGLFNPNNDTGAHFGTYAAIWIKQRIGHVRKMRKCGKRGGGVAQHVHLDTTDFEDGETAHTRIPDSTATDGLSQLARREDCRLVLEALSKLKPKDRSILVRRFGIGCEAETLREIADADGVTHQRVSQRQSVAMKRLWYKVVEMERAGLKA